MTYSVGKCWPPTDLGQLLTQHGGADVVIGMFGGPAATPRGRRGAALLGRLLGVDLDQAASADPDFDGSPGSRTTVLLDGPGGAVRVLLVGLGTGSTPADLFDAALASSTGRPVISTLALENPAALGLVAQGHGIGCWRYQRQQPPRSAGSPALHLLGDPQPGDDRALARAAIVARATNWVRQLVETPANMLGPREFSGAIADLAAELAAGTVIVERWDAATLEQRGFGGTLGVAAGSDRAALVVAVRIEGTGPPTALAGKGITFDSGGVNIKRSLSELSWMKSDMAAAASVAAAVIAAAALGATEPVIAILPIAENMPGGSALRPGDVLVHPGGRTTEVLDTDSEGRIVLADALGYLAALSPKRLIDVGTLTDSGGVGHRFWGCWSNSDELAAATVAAGDRACDRGWHLPLHESYTAQLTSRVADIANAPTAVPDSGQLAATYLRSFVDDTPWVHIDNGSSAWLEADARPWPAGPTGTPVRALIELLAPHAT